MMRAPRVPVFRVAGRVTRDGHATVVETVTVRGARYRLRREFADDVTGRMAATRIVDLLYDHGTIDPAKWVKVGIIDDMEHEGLAETENAYTGNWP